MIAAASPLEPDTAVRQQLGDSWAEHGAGTSFVPDSVGRSHVGLLEEEAARLRSCLGCLPRGEFLQGLILPPVRQNPRGASQLSHRFVYMCVCLSVLVVSCVPLPGRKRVWVGMQRRERETFLLLCHARFRQAFLKVFVFFYTGKLTVER